MRRVGIFGGGVCARATFAGASPPSPHIMAQLTAHACTLVDMRKIADIRTFEDRALLRWISRASALAFGIGVLATAGFAAALRIFMPSVLDPALAGLLGVRAFSSAIMLAWLVVLAVASMAALLVHELVHALFFKLFAPSGARVTFGANWGAGMLFACAEGIVYARRRYLAIVIAPTIVVTALVLVIGAAFGVPVLGCAVAAIHLCGCAGDWYYVRTICRNPAIAYCEDTTWGVRLFGEGEEARA